MYEGPADGIPRRGLPGGGAGGHILVEDTEHFADDPVTGGEPVQSRRCPNEVSDMAMREPGPLSVTEEELFAIIGRLHVENMVLRARLAEQSGDRTLLHPGTPVPHEEPADEAHQGP
jgi:hypothetical protein